jgi:Hydroxymethylglutaryl-coenzyme A synthase N terminal
MSLLDKRIGVLAMEVYTPSTYIAQEALEVHSGVPPGKYTLGLGQEGLAVTGDAEDINSLCLTVVHSLLERQVNEWEECALCKRCKHAMTSTDKPRESTKPKLVYLLSSYSHTLTLPLSASLLQVRH